MTDPDRRDAACPDRAGGVAHAREGIDMAEPIPVKVTRYRCPHCGRSHSARNRAVEHIARCWYNPAARGCKTCKHFDNTYEDYGEDCNVGVDLSGRPACKACNGVGQTFTAGWDGGVSECQECGGDGAEIKPGPIVGCDRWVARGPEQP